MHAVIFDVDGTLLNSSEVDEALYKESVEAVLGSVRFRRSLNDYRYVTDSGILLQVFEDNAIGADAALTEQIQRLFYSRIEDYIAEHGPFREIDGAKGLLEWLKQSDEYAVGIATGGWRRTAELKLTTAGFDLAGVPLTSSNDAVDRSDIMRLALSSLGEDFQSILYFGDAVWDQTACEKLEWQFQAVGAELGGLLSYADFRIEPHGMPG